jgi:hypothetical protein
MLKVALGHDARRNSAPHASSPLAQLLPEAQPAHEAEGKQASPRGGLGG